MFKHKPIITSFSLFAFTTLALAACDPGPEELSDDLAVELTAELAVTDSVLDRVGTQVELLDVSALELPETTMSPEAARELVAGAVGVGLDLAKVDQSDLASLKPVVDAAMQLGVPMIIEHIDSSKVLAELIGAGIEADVVMVTTVGPNRYRVRVYGGDDGDSLLAGDTDEPIPSWWPAQDSLELAADEFSATLLARADTVTNGTVPVSTPANGYVYYDFDMAEEQFNPGDNQISTLSMDFEVELALDSARSKKNVFIRPIGSGQHPGTLISDSSSNRGYYQESQEVSITPNNGNVSLYAHAPSTPNSGSTYTSSTGWSIGSSGGWPEISYSVSNQTSTTLSDFSMVNNTAGSTASWRFYMSTSWSNMFNHPAFQKCNVKSLPALAKSNLFPEFEVVYRSNSSFSGTVGFDIVKQTLLRRIWRGGDIVTCKKYSNLWTLTRYRTLAINFGSV